uniref:C1q domain-containing protein n=1 Tax=Zosterops lateralis melanops TaxID=1220523 RepID=A0A8D2Q0C4_ZOSLA
MDLGAAQGFGISSGVWEQPRGLGSAQGWIWDQLRGLGSALGFGSSSGVWDQLWGLGAAQGFGSSPRIWDQLRDGFRISTGIWDQPRDRFGNSPRPGFGIIPGIWDSGSSQAGIWDHPRLGLGSSQGWIWDQPRNQDHPEPCVSPQPQAKGAFLRGSGLNLLTGRFTAPVGGIYQFSANIHVDHSELKSKVQLRARDNVRVLICIESLCHRHTSLEVIAGLESNSKIFTIYVHGLLQLQVRPQKLRFSDPNLRARTWNYLGISAPKLWAGKWNYLGISVPNLWAEKLNYLGISAPKLWAGKWNYLGI